MEHSTNIPDLREALTLEYVLLESLDPEAEDFEQDRTHHEQNIARLERRLEDLDQAAPYESPRDAMRHAQQAAYSQLDGSNDQLPRPNFATDNQVQYPLLGNRPQSSSSSSVSDHLHPDPQLQRKRMREHTLSSPQASGSKFPRYTPTGSPSTSGRSTPHTGGAWKTLVPEHGGQSTTFAGSRQQNLFQRLPDKTGDYQRIGTGNTSFGQIFSSGNTNMGLPSQQHVNQQPLTLPCINDVLSPPPSGYNNPAAGTFANGLETHRQNGYQNAGPRAAPFTNQLAPSNLKYEQYGTSNNNLPSNGPSVGTSRPTAFIDLTGSSDDEESQFTELTRPQFHSTSQQLQLAGDPFEADLSRYYPPMPSSQSQFGGMNLPGSVDSTMMRYKQQMQGLGSYASNASNRMYSTVQNLARGVGDGLDHLLGYGSGSSSRGSRDLPWEVGNDSSVDRYDPGWGVTPQETKEQLQKLLENINADEDKEETPMQLEIELKEHQKIGLAWLRKMEDGTNKGGILADDMGLGKTVQALALMIARPSKDPKCKTTLIIAPLALMRQWEKEMKTKVKPRYRLATYIYHGPNRKQSFEYLRNFDCVLTTFGTLATERKRKEKWEKIWESNPSARMNDKDRYPLLDNDTKWYRVILDEAQNIKNKDALTSKAAGELNACTRICMTGTPMMNNVNELYSLIRFLGIKPYCYWNRFREDIGTPITKWAGNNEPAMEKLRVLWKAIALRRKKDSKINGQPIIVIPPKVVESDHVKFDEEQKALYTALETRTQVQFNRYLKKNNVMNNYANMLVLLLRLRQACCHPHLINDLSIEAPGNMTVDGMKELAEQFSDDVVTRIKNEEGAFQCPVCFDATENPSLSFPCGHVLCLECFAKVTDPANAIIGDDGDSRPKCPSCRERLDANKVVDYRAFCRVHIPDKFPEDKQDEPAYESDDDDEEEDLEDEDDNDDDDDDESNLEDDTLDGFIVKTDDEGDGEEKYSAKQKAAMARRKARATSKGKGKAKVEPDGELDTNDVLALAPYMDVEASSSIARKSGVVKDEDDDYEDTSESKEPIRAKGKDGKKATKVKGKGKGHKKRDPSQKKPPKKTLAQLKTESKKSKAARKLYLKRLQKQWEPSAKLDKTMDILRTIRENDSSEKIIIFSQWTSLLDLLEVPINREGWGCQRYDGSMKPSERVEALEEFTESPGCTILLTSLKAGNAGLNLHQASQVIMLDPFWNPYVEDQAIDRAHRFPQQRQVCVHRVLTTETVEDRIIELQEKKKMLIEAAMDETAGKNIARLGVREFGYLFGLNSLNG